MPPKFKFTRDEIIGSALKIVRKSGIDALTARALAEELGCSVKPIFGLFKNMEELQNEVLMSAHSFYQSFLQKDISKGEYPVYKSAGTAYIRFAGEEKELFKLLFMRDRSDEIIAENREEVKPFIDLITEKTGISEDEAYFFHLEMWIFVHGIATMIATGYLEWTESIISRSLTDMFEGLKSRYSKGGLE